MPKKAARKSGWKDVQHSREITKKTKLGVITLLLVLLLILLAQVVKFTKSMFSSWHETTPIKRVSLWNEDYNLNTIIRTDSQTALLSYDPKDKQITILNLPNQTYIDTAYGFGKWLLGSVYGVGESQNNLGGDKLLKRSLEDLLGLPIDGVITFSGNQNIAGFISKLRTSPFGVINLLSNIKTNLTPYELLKLNMGLSSVRFDKVKTINLGDVDGLLQQSNLPDGTPILTADLVKLDSISSTLVEPILQNEHETIAIFNSTKTPALAQKAAREISNIGGNVIITSNGTDDLQKTVIIGGKSKTLQKLKQIFGSNDIIDPKLKDQASSRAQINIFLGEDYVN